MANTFLFGEKPIDAAAARDRQGSRECADPKA